MRGLRSAGTLATLTALALTCAACSSGSGGSDSSGSGSSGGTASGSSRPGSTTSTAKASASTTPAAAGPIVPSAARAHTPAGAVAFVKFYIDEVNTAWTTPQTGLIPALSLPSCKSCAHAEGAAERFVQTHTRYERPTLALRDPEWAEDNDSKSEAVTAVAIESPSPIVGDGQRWPSQGVRRESARAIDIKWVPDGWRIAEVKDLR